jgi:hypothetical protein
LYIVLNKIFEELGHIDLAHVQKHLVPEVPPGDKVNEGVAMTEVLLENGGNEWVRDILAVLKGRGDAPAYYLF